MTRYTVVWLHSTLGELAELWLNSLDRNSVSDAVSAIDVTLSEDASQKGNDLSEGLRVLEVSPLRILFALREDDRIVEVVRVTEKPEP